jgi:hypothetical protein
MNSIAIGRLLRANTTGCVIGCRVTQANIPAFGDLLRIPLAGGSQIYGLVHDIHIDDDGLVRQLVTADVSTEIIEDNRHNRNVPVEMSVIFLGWKDIGAKISHTRVPFPPLTLDEIFPCSVEEIREFTANGKFGYLRSILRNQELPAADLITAHLRQVLAARSGIDAANVLELSLNEVIALMKDDYPQLMDVLTAVSEIL